MRNLLASSGRAQLRRLAAADASFAFDFDGTLAPIVANRHDAAMRPVTRELLGQLASHRPCFVVSGRALDDLAPRLTGVPLEAVYANHGIEPDDASPEIEARVARWREIALSVASPRGMSVEDKRFSLTVHFTPGRAAAARQYVERIVEAEGPARVMPGLNTINILPGGAPDKGTAVAAIHRRRPEGTVLYIGDDVTDEDVFSLRDSSWLLAVRVGRSRVSDARHFIPDQAAVDPLLIRLLELAPGLRR